jgi:hypothetical protein
VLPGLLQVLLEALLVGRLLGQRYVSREVDLQLGLLGVGLVEPLDQLGVTFVDLGGLGHGRYQLLE